MQKITKSINTILTKTIQMIETVKIVRPLQLNLGHKRIFTVNVSLSNKHLSDKARFATIKEVKIKKLDNDEANRQVIINEGMGEFEIKLDYDDTTISIEESEAKKGAAVFNRQEKKDIQKDIEELLEKQIRFEDLLKFYDEELSKVNLM